MVSLHKPAMLVLLETKMEEHKNLVDVLRFDTHIQSHVAGSFGGIVVMWKEDSLVEKQGN